MVVTYEDQFPIMELKAVDPDDDAILDVFVVSKPIRGSLYQAAFNDGRGMLINATLDQAILVTNAMNKVIYVPERDFYGSDSFSFKARDSLGAESGVQTAQIMIVSLPDPPVPQSKIISLYEDTNITFDIFATDPDEPGVGQNIFFSILSLPNRGSLFVRTSTDGISSLGLVTSAPYHLAMGDSTLLFRPAENDFGNPYASFNFKASDGLFDSESNGTITFIVAPVNGRL
ncbi:hypothetical protein BKA69DRAFT_591367 [Paraphysoderma sedebokerense]|nr:hypothetical protein BKA69DRAFT_591367 [Paraphysoderma sedebokerense]